MSTVFAPVAAAPDAVDPAVPLERAVFRNTFVEELPGEESGDKRPRQVPGVCWSRAEPTPVADPHLLAWSRELAAFLGLEEPPTRGAAVDILGGNRLAPGMKPFAARYAGHQFGNWAGQLGDGRAISLGEAAARDGSWREIQLKGAGPTPYSRRADGRAVLRSSVREFLCSEAMFHLGVPTTRALSLVATGDWVIRDMFYDGDAKPEPGAVVARVAPTFVRFGNFEMMTAAGETENLRLLADYVMRHHYGEFAPGDYAGWFAEVCRRTAVMIAHWMTVGFVHGVMNTDNMSILGFTIDYGPYGWLEPFDPDWTPNTTDFGTRRYAFGQQPRVALWNLMMLAQALAPLAPDADELARGLETYQTTLSETWLSRARRKLGLTAVDGDDADGALLEALHAALAAAEADMTVFFRRLSHEAAELTADAPEAEGRRRAFVEAVSYTRPGSAGHDGLIGWLGRYRDRLAREGTDADARRAGMLAVNPKYVPRNYLAQQAIEAAEGGDLSVLHTLMDVLKTPYDERPEHEKLAGKRPEWARTRPGCATLSCSS